MKRRNLFFIGIIIIIIILVIVGVLIGLNSQNFKKKKIIMPEKNLQGKKIVIVIAFRDFRDEEYFVPKEIFKKAGIEVKTASNKKGVAIGADGGEVGVDFLISELNPADFDAMVFVGGPGCLKNLDNGESYEIIRRTVAEGKVLAAICISPVILAKTGVLAGKKATVWASALDRSPVKILKENGAIYQDESVIVDGKIITANGPAAAQEFGQTIMQILK